MKTDQSGEDGTLPAIPASESDAPVFLNLEEDGEILNDFVVEARDHLQGIEQSLLDLEQGGANREPLLMALRAFHSLKGLAGCLNMAPVHQLAHELEALLGQVRDGAVAFDRRVTDVVLSSHDIISKYVADIRDQVAGKQESGPIFYPVNDTLLRVEMIRQGHGFEAPAPVSPGAAKEESAAGAGTGDGHTEASHVRVDCAKLEALVELVGEVMHRYAATGIHLAALGQNDAKLHNDWVRLGQACRELQQTGMSLRLTSIRPLFQRMKRLIRDQSLRQQKPVRLILHGEGIELDRHLIEQMADPLTHLVRNSISHGLETPEERRQAGKPETATLELRAFHQGYRIVLQCRDDGAGLHYEKIRRRAIERKLIAEGAQVSQEELKELIFTAGFSTAEQVDRYAGRGIGLDVVRKNIEQLGGRVSIDSEAGRGCTITISLPLTAAILEGVAVRSGAGQYVVPANRIVRTFCSTGEELINISNRAAVVNWHAHLYPCLHLEKFLAGSEYESADGFPRVFLLVESEGARIALAVDEILGKYEVLIKPLGASFERNDLFGGASLLPTGRIGLILNVASLVRRAQPGRKAAAAESVCN